MTSGGSVIGLVYDNGVLLASDTLMSYGSLAKLPNVPRAKILGSNTVVCATGDYGDFQDVVRTLQQQLLRDSLYEDGIVTKPSELFCTLHRMMYYQRSRMEPAQCQFVLAGHADGKPFLGGVDDIGTKWTDLCVGTGYGAHIAIPIMRRALERTDGKLTRDQAMSVVQDCLRALFYRECRTINKFQIADATNGKVVIGDPITLDTNWDYKGFDFSVTAIIS